VDNRFDQLGQDDVDRPLLGFGGSHDLTSAYSTKKQRLSSPGVSTDGGEHSIGW
jgi:hypothetical protein